MKLLLTILTITFSMVGSADYDYNMMILRALHSTNQQIKQERLAEKRYLDEHNRYQQRRQNKRRMLLEVEREAYKCMENPYMPGCQ